MDRRDFSKMSLWSSLGGLLIPTSLLTSCGKTQLFEDLHWNGKVLIVGAGASGLYAGYLLRSKGIDFEILEASDRPGGRMGKLEGFADYPLDRGAQWLHGKNSVVGDLIKYSKQVVEVDRSKQKFWFQGQLVDKLPKDIEALFEQEEDLADVSFSDFAQQSGFGEEYNYIVEAIAGDSGAAADAISAFWKVKEEEHWSSGSKDYKFRKTFWDLFETEVIPHVEDRIRFNSPVERIHYAGSKSQIFLRDGSEIRADKVLITAPISILQAGDISFFPELPSAKLDAFSKIGMGPGMKVFLRFSEKFYDENIIGGQICAAYADESVGKIGQDHVLLAFVMGKQAQMLHNLASDEARATALLQELDGMYNNRASESFLNAHVENWTDHPFIKGAYSYSKVGIGNARVVASESVDNRLFFAGEAMNLNGHHQTVHGAVESAYLTLLELLKSAEA